MPLSRSPFPALLLFLIYLYLYHISTIHSHLTSLLLWHLLLITSKEDGGRNLLSYDLHCSGHFLINATDKTVVYHLMRMQQATPDQKFHYYPLTFTLFRLQLSLIPWFISSLPREAFFLGPMACSIPTPMLQPFNFILGPQAPTIFMCHNF